MKTFCEIFQGGIDFLIKKEIEKRSKHLNKYESLLYDAKKCQNLTNNMLYNENLNSVVEKYILDSENNYPFILIGQSGAGKSTLMASVLKRVR